MEEWVFLQLQGNMCENLYTSETSWERVAPVVTDKLPLAIQGFAHRYQLSLSDSLLITEGEKYWRNVEFGRWVQLICILMKFIFEYV